MSDCIPVVLVSSIDPVLRDAVTGGLLCDRPGALVVRHELLPQVGQLRRVVSDLGGVRQDRTEVLEHGCLTCSLVEDVGRLVAELSWTGPHALLLALPPAADPVPVVHALRSCSAPVVVATSVAVLDPTTLEHDVLGSDLLAERGLAFGDADRRSVGEALVRQLESADLLAPAGPPEPGPARLLDHLVGDEPARIVLHDLDGAHLIRRRRGDTWARRGDLRLAASTGAPDRDGVWTVDLQSWKPFHPQRLLDRVERLGAGPLRGRGYFWLPTRPGVVCAWDGAGGQLAIGELGEWRAAPATRLVITGTGERPEGLATAFDETLMTDRECSAGLESWRGRPDGWDAWLSPSAGRT